MVREFEMPAGGATETVAVPVVDDEESSSPDLPWQVVVYDDPVNLMAYVTMVFRRIFGYSEAKATELMLQVHRTGKSIVWSGAREKAEFYVQQLHAHQLQASMSRCD
jgi:ATP-dependent Clp protease adaptor protein ClpS